MMYPNMVLLEYQRRIEAVTPCSHRLTRTCNCPHSWYRWICAARIAFSRATDKLRSSSLPVRLLVLVRTHYRLAVRLDVNLYP